MGKHFNPDNSLIDAYWSSNEDSGKKRRKELADTQGDLETLHEATLEAMPLLIEQVYAGLYWLASSLGTREVADSTFSIRIAGLGGFNRSPVQFVDDVWAQNGDKVLKNIKISGKVVEVSFDLFKGLDSSLWIAPRSYYDRPDTEQLRKAEAALKAIFPGFTLPKVGAKKTVTRLFNNTTALPVPGEPLWEEDEGVAEMYIEESLQQDYERVLKSVKIDYRITITDTEEPYVHTKSNDVALEYTIGCTATLKLPVEFCHWVLSDAKKLSLSMLRRLFVRALSHNYGQASPPVRINPPREMKAHLDEYMGKYKGFSPRTNAEGWIILPNGDFHKFEGTDGSKLIAYYDDMDRLLEKAYSDEIGEDTAEFKKEIDEINKKYAGQDIFVDWINDVLIYTANDNKLQFQSIIGASPVLRGYETQVLETELADPRYNYVLSNLISHCTKALNEVDKEKFTGDSWTFRPAYKGDSLFTNLVLGSHSRQNQICIKHLAGIDLHELEENRQYVQDIESCQALAKLIRDAAKLPFEKIIGNRSKHVFNGMERWFLETLSKLTPDNYRLDYQAAYSELLKSYDTSPVKLEDDIDLPNIDVREGKFDSLLPHQVELYGTCQKRPPTALFAVDTGGGKTILAIIDAMLNVDAGLKSGKPIKRPLVLTQGNLVPDMITEINTVSNGKIYAVSLRMDNINRVIKEAGMTSAVEFINWVHSFPENTIFVAAYTDLGSGQQLFDDMYIYGHYLDYEEDNSQVAHIFAAAGFEYIYVDESHKIKNKEAYRSKAVTYLLSRAEIKREASATVANNTVNDYYGQISAINPFALGTEEDFQNKYGIVKGIITNVKLATQLKQDLKASTALVEKRKSSWSFMLPNLIPDFHFPKMTELQTSYYNLLMKEAFIEISQKMEEIASSNSSLTDEEIEARVEAMLKRGLAKVDVFLVAPDEHENYVKWTEKPRGEDLVSPVVKKTDELIRKHFNGKVEGKVIVFGYNLAASRHMMRHSAFKNVAMHYTAGNLEAIRRFKEDPNVKVLIADETSMKEGQNLQIASRVIRTQTVWAPGDYEQALSRMYRPDPRGRYKREEVYHDWIVTAKDNGEATFATAKVARMISKAVSNAQVGNADNSRWKAIAHQFGDLPLLTMNLDLVFDFNNIDAAPYLGGWQKFQKWLNAENQEMRRLKASQLQAQYGVELIDDNNNIIDVAQFTKLAMRQVKSSYNIGSVDPKRYTPWQPFARPPEIYGMEMELVNDDPIEVGEIVYCEFGPAEVVAVLTNSIRVQASHGKVTLHKAAIARPVNENDQKKLDKMWKAGTYAIMPPTTKQLAKIAKNPLFKEPKILKPKGEEENLEVPKPKKTKAPDLNIQDEEEIELNASAVNGMPALFSKNLDTDLIRLHGTKGWKQVSPFISVQFANWKAAETFLDKLNDQFTLNTFQYNALYEVVENMRSGRTMRIQKMPDQQLIRNFFLDTTRKMGYDKDGYPRAKPYWIVWGDQIRLAFDVDTHPPELMKWLSNTGRRVKGVVRITKSKGMWINFFRTMKEAQADALSFRNAIKGVGKFDDKKLVAEMKKAQTLLSSLKKVKGKK